MNFILKSNPRPWHHHHVPGISRVLKGLCFSTYTLTSSSSSSSSSGPIDSLYRRITDRAGNSKESIIPIIEQWLHEGKFVKQSEIQRSVKKLRKHRRFSHALQILQWMSNKRGCNQAPGDFAVQLGLISKLQGIEQAEQYYNSIPDDLRSIEVYGALLNSYVRKNNLDKAEAIMQKIRELGFVRVHHCNAMLKLYSLTGKHEKLNALVKEMEEKGIGGDTYTFNIRLNNYVAISNIKEMEKLLMKMETDPHISFNCHTCFIVANGYLKAGLIEKSLKMLKKAEQLIIPTRGNSKRNAYEVLLTMYGAAGNKDGVYRVWNLYKNIGHFFNSGYQHMIGTLMKLDDFDGAERIWEERLSRKTLYDFQIPNMMISAYSERGLWQKAEALVKKIVEEGVELPPSSWDRLATGFIVGGQMVKAVETIKKAISISQPRWKPSVSSLAACLEWLQSQRDVKAAEELWKQVREHCHFSPAMCAKLKTCVENANLSSRALGQMEGDDQNLMEETPTIYLEVDDKEQPY